MDQQTEISGNQRDTRKIPYQLPQPFGMRPDMLMAKRIDLSADERLVGAAGRGRVVQAATAECQRGLLRKFAAREDVGSAIAPPPFGAGPRLYASRAMALSGA